MSDEFWERVRSLRRAAIHSDPDRAVTDACLGEAKAIAGERRVEDIAHALEVEAHERGLLQRCPPLRVIDLERLSPLPEPRPVIRISTPS